MFPPIFCNALLLLFTASTVKFKKQTIDNNIAIGYGMALGDVDGEIKVGNMPEQKKIIATIEPMHGSAIAIYLKNNTWKRVLRDDNIKEGHALGVADFSGNGTDQIVAGWRAANKDGKVGIKFEDILE
ncbi:MAG: hypothetical protein IT249_03190 [Chitinophagaceae bacterium]|nr:hypothetical protein [Chitinophagaceae bacterium]